MHTHTHTHTYTPNMTFITQYLHCHNVVGVEIVVSVVGLSATWRLNTAGSSSLVVVVVVANPSSTKQIPSLQRKNDENRSPPTPAVRIRWLHVKSISVCLQRQFFKRILKMCKCQTKHRRMWDFMVCAMMTARTMTVEARTRMKETRKNSAHWHYRDTW